MSDEPWWKKSSSEYISVMRMKDFTVQFHDDWGKDSTVEIPDGDPKPSILFNITTPNDDKIKHWNVTSKRCLQALDVLAPLKGKVFNVKVIGTGYDMQYVITPVNVTPQPAPQPRQRSLIDRVNEAKAQQALQPAEREGYTICTECNQLINDNDLKIHYSSVHGIVI